jgi:hypothetical protein
VNPYQQGMAYALVGVEEMACTCGGSCIYIEQPVGGGGGPAP